MFVFEFKNKYHVKDMRKVLGISKSGYYRWLKNRNKPTKQQLLLVEIEKVLAEHPDNSNYGSQRMHTALIQKGITVSERTVYRAMKAGGYIHRHRKPHSLTKATTEIQEKENLIKRDFSFDKPMTKLLTDITEVQCSDGKLYIYRQFWTAIMVKLWRWKCETILKKSFVLIRYDNLAID